jgi:hypothetical protein
VITGKQREARRVKNQLTFMIAHAYDSLYDSEVRFISRHRKTEKETKLINFKNSIVLLPYKVNIQGIFTAKGKN